MLVLDRDEPDQRLVRLAYLWSKSVAARNKTTENSMNIGKIESLLQSLQTEAKSISTLKRHHTLIADGLAYSKGWVEEHGQKFDQLYQELYAELLGSDNETE
jgi:hypothetical protein